MLGNQVSLSGFTWWSHQMKRQGLRRQCASCLLSRTNCMQMEPVLILIFFYPDLWSCLLDSLLYPITPLFDSLLNLTPIVQVQPSTYKWEKEICRLANVIHRVQIAVHMLAINTAWQPSSNLWFRWWASISGHAWHSNLCSVIFVAPFVQNATSNFSLT